MQELIATAFNELAVFASDQYGETHAIPMAEVILVTTEPYYELNASGNTEQVRKNETFRFSTTIKGLLRLADDFIKEAKRLEELSPPKQS